MPWHPKTASTTALNAVERQLFLDNLVTDLRRVRLSNDPTKWEFSGLHPAASASQSGLPASTYATAKKSSHVRHFLRVVQSLVRRESSQNLQFLPKVFPQCLKNSREKGSRDQFDYRLPDRGKHSVCLMQRLH